MKKSVEIPTEDGDGKLIKVVFEVYGVKPEAITNDTPLNGGGRRRRLATKLGLTTGQMAFVKTVGNLRDLLGIPHHAELSIPDGPPENPMRAVTTMLSCFLPQQLIPASASA